MEHRHVDNFLKDLLAWVQTEHDIVAAYLYGSCAHGRANALSDVDVALLARPELSREQLWQLEDRCVVHWPDWVDLRLLNLAPFPFRYEVTAQGRRLWARDLAYVAAWESLTWRRYWDIQPRLEHNWQQYVKRVEEQRDEVERQQYQTALAKVRTVHRRTREASIDYPTDIQK